MLFCGHDGKHPNSKKMSPHKSITVAIIEENKCSFPRFSVRSKKILSFTQQWLMGPILGTEQMAKSDIAPNDNPTNHCKMRLAQILSLF